MESRNISELDEVALQKVKDEAIDLLNKKIEDESKESVELRLTANALKNLYLVSEGKISEAEAIRNVGDTVANSYGMSQEVANRKIGNGLVEVAKTTNNQALQTLAKNYGESVGSVTTVAALSVINSLAKGEEIKFDDVLNLMIDKAVKGIGTMFGGVAGVMATTLTVAMIKEIILICRNTLNGYKLDTARRKNFISRFNKLNAEAVHALSEQKIRLQEVFSANRLKFDVTVERGFEEILKSAMDNDANGIALGIDILMKPFNGKSQFSNLNEFKTFFNNSDSVLRL